MIDAKAMKTARTAKMSILALGAALALGLSASPAAAKICPAGAQMPDAGKVVKTNTTSVKAQNCSDGKFINVAAKDLIGQKAKRVGSGAYILPNYKGGIRVLGALIKVSK